MNKREASIQQTNVTETDWQRVRFTICLAIFGGTLGAVTVLVNFLSQTISPVYGPEHMSFGRSLLFASGGALAGILVSAPTAYWLFGTRPVFSAKRRQARGFLKWAIWGGLYGLVFPLVLGGFLLPMSGFFLDWYNGIFNVLGLFIKNLDLLTGRWIPLAFVFGTGRLFFTGLFAGLVFWPGAWLIDKFNTSSHQPTALYGSWIVAIGLSVLLVALLVFTPELTLSKLG